MQHILVITLWLPGVQLWLDIKLNTAIQWLMVCIQTMPLVLLSKLKLDTTHVFTHL